jgi:hypothetical protein
MAETMTLLVVCVCSFPNPLTKLSYKQIGTLSHSEALQLAIPIHVYFVLL